MASNNTLNKKVNYAGQSQRQEHDDTANVALKKVGAYGWYSDNMEYRKISVNDDGSLNVVPNGSEVDTNNSTTTPLGIDEVFTGASTEILHFSAITILVEADQDSAADGLIVEFSGDGVDWHGGESYMIPANTAKFFTPPVQAQYFRVIYTNGGVAQASFHLHTILKKNPIKWSSHNLQDNLNDQDDAELNVSVLKLRTAQNNYVSGSATNSGNFKVSLEEFDGSFNTTPLPVSPQLVDNATLDAFGRQRISGTGQRFDVEFIYDKQPPLMDEIVTGGGSIDFNSDSRDVSVKVNDTATSSAEFVQRWHNPYTPGNSQLVDITGTLDAGNIGGGTASIFLKDGITSTEIVIDQANWNQNTVSDVDWTKSQIFSMDFQSLKVGRLRFGLVRDGIFVPVHYIVNDNIRTSGYWQYPNQPLNWKIYNEGGNTITEIGYFNGTNGIGFRYTVPVNANAEIRAICATVKSEGGESLFDMPGYTRDVDMGITSTSVGTTLIPILSIRPRATFGGVENKTLCIPEYYGVQTDNPIRLVLLGNPTLTGASWTDVNTLGSAMEYDISATAVTGGLQVASEYASTSRNTNAGSKGLLGRTLLTYTSSGTNDTLTLAAVRTSSSSADVLANIGWREIR